MIKENITRNGIKTIYEVNDFGEIIAKQCNKCGTIKKLSDYGKSKNNFAGTRARCKQCRSDDAKIYSAQEHVKEASKLRMRKRRENPEVIQKERQKKKENQKARNAYNRKWYAQNVEYAREYKKEWYQENLERVREYIRLKNQLRKAREHDLPNTLTIDESASLKNRQNNVCILSGSYDITLEHFIPISWGAGGTTFENCYYMDASLNFSKNNKNPFEWIKTQLEEYRYNFHTVLVPEMAKRNNMTVEAFTEYIYECEKAYKSNKYKALA